MTDAVFDVAYFKDVGQRTMKLSDVIAAAERATQQLATIEDRLKAHGWSLAGLAECDFDLAAVLLALGWAPPQSMDGVAWRKTIDTAAAAVVASSIATERAKSQTFFAGLAKDILRPSYGVLQKDFVVALLVRAQENGLYLPEEQR